MPSYQFFKLMKTIKAYLISKAHLMSLLNISNITVQDLTNLKKKKKQPPREKAFL